MSQKGIHRKVQATVRELVHEKGYASALDLMLRMGKIAPKQVDDWRFGRVPYLEKVIQGSLGKCNSMLSSLRVIGQEMGLKASHTAYMRWGKGPKQPLRFSKSGLPHLEKQYATHFVAVKPKAIEPTANSLATNTTAAQKAGTPE